MSRKTMKKKNNSSSKGLIQKQKIPSTEKIQGNEYLLPENSKFQDLTQ